MSRPLKPLNYLVVFILLIVLLFIIGSAILYYNQQKKFVRNSIEKELNSIVKLKVDQVNDWYADELLDTWTISRNIHLLKCIKSFSDKQTEESTKNLFSFLENLKVEHGYENIYFLSTQGEYLIGTNKEKIHFNSEVIDALDKSIEKREAVSTNIYLCNYCKQPHLDFISFVETDEGEIIGGLLFHINPEKKLFPSINHWPSAYSSARIYFYRHDGDSLRILNVKSDSLKIFCNTAIPNEREHYTSGFLTGNLSRITEGKDFFGNQVVGYSEPVSLISWLISAKIDKEVVDDAFMHRFYTYAVIFTLLISILLLLAFIWFSVRQKNEYKRQAIGQKEFEIVLKSIGDAVVTTDKEGRVRYMNPMAEQLTGWHLAEANQRRIDEVFNICDDLTKQKAESPVETVLRAGKAVDLSNHTILTSKMGNQMPIADCGAPITTDEGEVVGVVMVFRDQSKEYSHRKEIEENARQFSTLFSNLPGMAYRCCNDDNWTMEFVSDKCYELTGYSADELVANRAISYNQLIDKEYNAHIWDKVQEALSARRPFEFEYRIQTKSGDKKWVWERGCGVFNEKGELIHLEGFISDITALIKTMQALTQREESYRSMVENLNDLIVNVDAKNHFTFVSPSYCNLFGKTPEELLGKSFMPMVHPDDQEETSEQMKKLFSHPYSCFLEQRAMTVKGWRWLAWSDKAVLDHKGKVASIVGVGRDITARKLAESEMQKLSKAIIQSPVIIVITDPRGYIEYVNPKFTEVTGYESFEVLGRTPSILKSGNHQKEFYQELWNTILAGKDWKGELNNRKRNGEIYWENAIISPILNEKGKIIHFVAVKEDITEKKRMIRELIDAKERAELADKLKSSFLANMSHEIRTPLNSIIGFTSFIVSDEKYMSSDEKEKYFEIISKNADNLLQIINDIIDLSRLETGQLVVNKTEFSLQSLFDSLNAVFSQKIKEVNKTNIELVMQNPSRGLQIYSDENRLNQILSNLISNAIKFTNNGQIVFGLESINESHIKLFVSDTGIGINNTMQAAVFERFRQVEDSHTRSYGGNGLGLSIVKYLVELLGGEITLQSTLGKGSVFHFSILYKPLSEVHNGEPS